MKPTAPISVVIPCFNSEKFLTEAIESVHSQTVRVAEIIVVDNNCTDNTCEIARSLRAKIVEQTQLGLPATRNAGIAACQNEWIAWLDSDDFWLPEKIEHQWKALELFPQSRIIFNISGVFNQFSNEKETIYDTVEKLPDQNLKIGMVKDAETVSCEHLTEEFFPFFMIDCSNSIFHREVFSTVGLFDESILYAEEIEFFYRAMAKFPTTMIRKILSYVRIHDHNMTRNQELRWKYMAMAADKMLKFPHIYPLDCGLYHLGNLKEWFINKGITESFARRAKMTK